MKAARLHGPKDIRIDILDSPPAPGLGEVLINVSKRWVSVVRICTCIKTPASATLRFLRQWC